MESDSPMGMISKASDPCYCGTVDYEIDGVLTRHSCVSVLVERLDELEQRIEKLRAAEAT